ncbi:tricarballylate utilization 4Fe-4S protein TcuB [Ideonella livida]|uniref:Tricarballylate utilization 4Fe-4S protein TcuB n=1 Tax=Ideonella livida TaxID=2707176 RepID=A0A7C9PIU9_9BURK|nr:tricarballylate utilization 4Fe-4S protein TcuB [Ideonella livida]NDY93113.1 tricarballylate utilization 4Fe-4S protein TcuB [Ideonella livida]
MSTPALIDLTRQARALANAPFAHAGAAEAEVARVLQICNACRYCEGFCAVFPAMTRRLDFPAADVHYLANLCHNCGACLHACQYAPPHEFAVNVPQAMARVRGQTYTTHAWPPALGMLYQRNGLVVALALLAALAAFLAGGVVVQGGWAGLWQAPAGANFYSVFPHHLLVSLFLPVFAWVVLALGLGLRRFWRGITPVTGAVPPAGPAQADAAHDVLTLKHLDGGHGDGCHEADEAYTLWRRRLHHLTFYGFGLCLAATGVATLMHYVLGQPAPYDLPSLPKLLGGVGGLSLLVGSLGLGLLRWRRHPLHGDAAQKPMDLGFIALLALSAGSGLALWAARGQPAMPALLCGHLGAVMALFLTMPYGKFAHGLYRSAALLRHHVERRLPNPIGLGAD